MSREERKSGENRRAEERMMKSCPNGAYMPLFKILTHPSLSPCNPSPKKPRTGLPERKRWSKTTQGESRETAARGG